MPAQQPGRVAWQRIASSEAIREKYINLIRLNPAELSYSCPERAGA